MDWLIDVQQRLKRKNSILLARDSPFLADLSDLISQINHRALVLWALELAEEAAAVLLLRYPDETRPQTAVSASADWAAGKVKMRAAQRAILDVHAFAGDIKSPEDIALCHAIGQACGVVHTVGHAMGFPVYEMTSIIRRYGLPACRDPADARLRHYTDRLLYWKEHTEDLPRQWAEFMLKE